jgi:3-oxoacyl-[acyl-carrier protein] reductase
MASRLDGKHVVVTGASSGIGRALALAFGAEGATVWLGARRVDELREVAREVDAAGGAGKPLKLDVTEDRSVAAFAKQVEACDVLVNNAGVGGSGRIDEMDVDQWRTTIATNLTGPFVVTKALLPKLREREGRRQVVNIVSVVGKSAFAGGGAYTASKFGLRGWTESLAAELAEEGIRVTAVLPGYVATPLVGGPHKKMIAPEDLAKHIVELCLLPESMFVDELTVWPWKMYAD